MRPKTQSHKHDPTTPLRLLSIEPPKNSEGESLPTGEERRVASDRRNVPTRGWDSILGFHRRQRGRRAGESENIYVDTYTRQDVALTVGILTLNILDAFFTLRWLDMGGGEGNPLMEMLIRGSDMLFLLKKAQYLILLLLKEKQQVAPNKELDTHLPHLPHLPHLLHLLHLPHLPQILGIQKE